MKLVIKAILKLLDEIFGQSNNDCQNGWIRYEESCYLVDYNDSMTFNESENFCKEHHGYVVHVDSAEENKFIVDWLHTTHAGFSCWLGLTDRDVEGKWVWYDTLAEPAYTNWWPHEPRGGDVEDCAVFFARHSTLAWDDYSCNHHFHPICEMTPHNPGGVIG